MNRPLAVARMQMLNKWLYLGIPGIILVSSTVIAIAVLAMVPSDSGEGTRMAFSGQSVMWYFLAAGVQSLSLTFPFSQAMSVSRRSFYIGTLGLFSALALGLGVLYWLLGLVERATNGWGVDGNIFALPWIAESAWWIQILLYFALTILLFLFDNKQFPKIASALVIVAAANFLYFSNSRTSQVLLIPAILLGFAIRPYSANHRTALGVFLLIVAAIAAQILSMNSAALAEIVNDPGTLTGRGSIWPLLIEYAREHPWTGAGFGSFWLIGDKSPIWTLTTGWVAVYAPHGHNGYLDLLVTIGIPGLILGLIALAIWPLLRLLLSLSIPKPRRSLLLTLIAFCLGHNLTESSLLNGAALVEVFLIVAIAITYRESNASAGAHHRLRTRLTRILRRRQVLARR